jgi:pseudouridine synthase
LLNKPKGYVTTLSDPEGRPTVMELVGKVEERVYPIGRLDFNTEGVLLLTNDGDLAHALMHPTREVKKTYRVKLRGTAGAEIIESLREGVTLDDGERTAPAQVEVIGNTEGGNNSWLEITIHEGKNRQIHRMAESLGMQVAKLQRVRYAGLDAEGLRVGRWRTLRRDEVDGLRKAAGMTKAVAAEKHGYKAAQKKTQQKTQQKGQSKARAAKRAHLQPRQQGKKI